MKCATVAIIGRPSAGKSTLLNTICEMKVSITASTPQTTRNAIRGIYTDSRGQLIFTDTPGFHLSEKTLNKRLQETALKSLEESDAVLYILDSKRSAGDEELALVSHIAKIKTPVVCVINKADIIRDSEEEAAKAFLAEHLPGRPVLKASAKLDEGVDEILIELFKLAPEGELLYPPDAYTDQYHLGACSDHRRARYAKGYRGRQGWCEHHQDPQGCGARNPPDFPRQETQARPQGESP